MPGTADSPSTTDRAFLRAIRAWGGPADPFAWARLSPGWRDRLRSARAADREATPESALADLRRDHEASARPDPSRVHPSWFVRALRAESPSVRLAIAALAAPPIRDAIRIGPGAGHPAPGPDRPPDPDAIGWALALWAERLVGDVADRADDPPVIVALARLRPRELARLVKACGAVKHAFSLRGPGPSEVDEALVRMTNLDRVRLAFFRRSIGTPDPRLVPAARADLRAIGDDRRRGHYLLGLLTFGRLLAASEPHRARWAIQHIPYGAARRMRDPSPPAIPARALVAWESWVLEAAWARLLAEGRIAAGLGGAS